MVSMNLYELLYIDKMLYKRMLMINNKSPRWFTEGKRVNYSRIPIHLANGCNSANKYEWYLIRARILDVIFALIKASKWRPEYIMLGGYVW